MKKLLVTILSLLLLCGCNIEIDPHIEELSVSGQIILVDDNGNADIDITNTELLNVGFQYGDSVTVQLENGYKLEDIPFLSGMYVEYGKPMVYGKVSKDKVSFIIKYNSFASESSASENMGYTISLKETGKYISAEQVGNLTYKNIFEDYSSIEVFANFREVKVGNIKENRLYRSASVVNDTNNRIQYTSKLALQNNIKTILNIIDKQDAYDGFIKELTDDAKTLHDSTTTILAPISADYRSEKNNKAIVEGLNLLINQPQPYLIHCLEGKDRTGYVFAILEALCNGTYQEIVDDYMISFENYYDVTKQSDPDKYNFIKETNIDAMLRFICETDDLDNANLQQSANALLIKYGMAQENIDKLVDILCQ